MRSRARARRAILALRVVALVAAVAAALVGVAVTRGDRATGVQGRYACPMHPDVTAGEQGLCPICGMQLEPRDAAPREAEVAASPFETFDLVRRRGFGQDARAPAWVDANGDIVATLDLDLVASLSAADHAVFAPASAPYTSIAVRPAGTPAQPWDRSTARVRFRPSDTSAAAPAAGEEGWLRLPAKRRETTVVPSMAVLEGKDGPYVLVAATDGTTLSPRPVVLGRTLGGMSAVVAGLREHDHVMVRSAYFVDAERRLRGRDAIEWRP